MKYTLWRTHKVRPAEYESFDFGGRVEIDTEVDEGFEDMTHKQIGKRLSQYLDESLDAEINSALSLDRPEMRDSHIWDYYTEE